MQIFTSLFKMSFFIALLSGFAGGIAQTHTIGDVLNAKSRGTGPIVKDNSVAGYYTFFELDKKDSRNSNYQLNILDQNLSMLSSKKFSASKEMVALEAAYNDQLLMIKFKDAKTKQYIYRTFDKDAKQAGIYKSPIYSSEYDYKAIKPGEEGLNVNLHPVGNVGFVNYSIKLKGGNLSKTRYSINFFPNNSDSTIEASGWKHSGRDESEFFESAEYLGFNGKLLLSIVGKRKGLFSQDIEDFILGLDVENGRKVFEIPMEDKKYAVLAFNAVEDPTTSGFFLFGYYFGKDAKTVTGESKGLFAFKMDSTGNITSRKYNSWLADISKLVPIGEERDKIREAGSHIFFHKFLRTANGNIFGIGEQYTKEASAWGIASTLLGGGRGGTSVVKIVVRNMYVFEFDPNFSIKGVKVVAKTKTDVELPGNGTGLVNSTRVLGYLVKYLDGFDYAFTQMSKDKSKFSACYTNYEHDKDNKGSVCGSINYDGDKLTTDKFNLTSKSTWRKIEPAKPGYIMITEYMKKEKKLEMRLEKINF